MRYYKIIKNNYISMIGKGLGNEEISKEEYDLILSVIQSRPTAHEGKDYKLKTDLTWEEYDLPIVEQVELQPSPAYLAGYDQALVDLLGGEQ